MNKKKHQNITIYTIGHSNLKFEKFLELLNENEIKIVVDVRSLPFSRYSPQFNKDWIKEELENAGIEYMLIEDEFVGNILGGRPRDEDCYEGSTIIYKKIMKKKWYVEGILELINTAKKKKTAIMCSEEDPSKCHRHHLITQSLLNNGITVFHIRGNGNIEKVQKDMVQIILPTYS